MNHSPFGAPVAIQSQISRSYLAMEREFTSRTVTHMILSSPEIMFWFSFFAEEDSSSCYSLPVPLFTET